MVGHNTRAKETKDKLNGRTQYNGKRGRSNGTHNITQKN